jgi:hypothetical protein
MAPNNRKVIAAGFDTIFYGLNDSTGFLQGSTTSAPAAGNQNGSGMARLTGAKTAPITVPESEQQFATGDDIVLAAFLFSAASLPAGVIEGAVNDLTLQALTQGTLVEDINDIAMGVLMPDAPDYVDMCLILQRQAKSYQSGSIGAKQVEGVIVMSTNITPLGSDSYTERQVATQRYGFVINPSDRMPFGLLLTNSVNGTTRAALRPFTAENFVHMHRWTGNGTQDDFFLEYTPVSQAKVAVYVDGVKQTVTTHYTVDTATKTITFVTPPANNAKIIALYEYVK